MSSRRLLQHAEVTAVDADGQTCLHMATDCSGTDCLIGRLAAEGHGRRRPRPQKATAAEGHGHRRPRPPRRSTSLRRGPGTVASNEARAMCWQGGMTASLEERPVDIFTVHDGFFACSQSSGLCFGVLGVRRHGHFSSLWRTSHLLADSNLLKKTWSQRR